jgi:hypothetical protein
MGCVQVVDGDYQRVGAEVDQTFSTFMKEQFAGINQQLEG